MISRVAIVEEVRRTGMLETPYAIHLHWKDNDRNFRYILPIFTDGEVNGFAIGAKVRLTLTPIDADPVAEELSGAYETIADLCKQVKELIPQARRLLTMKWVLTASLLGNLGLIAARFL